MSSVSHKFCAGKRCSCEMVVKQLYSAVLQIVVNKEVEVERKMKVCSGPGLMHAERKLEMFRCHEP